MTAIAADHPTHAELVEALGHLVYAAKREVPKVGLPGPATPWDVRHRQLDAWLTDLEAMGV